VRFKLDENLPVELRDDLRALGHDADTSRTSAGQALGLGGILGGRDQYADLRLHP
jgi:hypothetical protein